VDTTSQSTYPDTRKFPFLLDDLRLLARNLIRND